MGNLQHKLKMPSGVDTHYSCMKHKLSVKPSDLDGLTQVAHFDTFSPTYSDFMVNYKATDLKNICSSVIKCFHCLNVAKLIKQPSLSRQHKWDREGCAVVLNWEAAVVVEYMCWSREYVFLLSCKQGVWSVLIQYVEILHFWGMAEWTEARCSFL